jgi:hypothetical protein
MTRHDICNVSVTPAKAGVQELAPDSIGAWTPALAGVTSKGRRA